MTLKFAANISTLFTEYPFESRFKEAKNCGFHAVEFQDGYMLSPSAIRNAMLDSKVKVVLLNSHPGKQGDFGLAALPGRELDFSHFLSKTLEYLSSLDCKKVHILAGFKSDGFTEEQQLATYVNNLQIASKMLEEHSAIGVIEPICHEVKDNYFLSSFDRAVDIIKRVDRNNIKLLLDIYHLHKITQQVKGNLEKFYPYAGHIQISQDPGRAQPFHPGGKIDYQEVFDFLQSKHHQDFIGLEYFPTGSTTSSIEWVKMYL